ncbi:MAG: MFS transporter [Sphingomicrobium sp.]
MATRGQRQAGRLQGITLLVPSSLAVMAIVVLVPSLPLLMAHFHDLPGAAYRVPILLTAPAACLVFASPLAGWLADRFGRRRLLMVAMAIYAVVGSLPLVLDHYWPILASRIALGVVEATVLTVSTTLIGDFFHGADRARWLSYQIGVASIFATLFILAGGALSSFGWRGPFAIYGLVLPMLAAVALFTWEPTVATGAGADSSADPAEGFPWRSMAGFVVLTLFASSLFYFVLIQLPLMLAALGMPPSATSGLWLSVVSLGVTVGTLLFNRLHRLARPHCLGLALIVMALSFGAMSLCATIPPLIVAATVNQIGAGILMPTLLTWSTARLPYHFRGRGTGIWQGAFSLGQFVMPLIVVALSGVTGGLPGTLRWFAAAALLVGLVAILLGRAAAPRSVPPRLAA